MQNWTREAQLPRGKTFSSIEIAGFSQTNQGKLAKLQQDMGWSHSADNVLMRLFLNANVLITAAHYPGRKAAFIIDLGAQGQWELYSSAYALEEARRNLINSPKTCRGIYRAGFKAKSGIGCGNRRACKRVTARFR